MTFGQRIVQQRELLHLRWHEVAPEARLSIERLKQIENGDETVTLIEMKGLARVFELPLETLFYEVA